MSGWPIGEKIVGIGGGKDEYGNWMDATLTLERGPRLTIGLITHRKLVETQNALKLALSRDTGDPSHNWLECEQLSCVSWAGRRWESRPKTRYQQSRRVNVTDDEMDFEGAYEALTQVEKYSRALKADPANAWLRRCRDGWAERLSRCLVLNGVPYVGSGEPSLPVPAFGEDN